MKKIVIVGGGISGLAAAYQVQEQLRQGGAPVECILIERQKQFGGKILTERHDGFIIEAGPDSFITQKPWALELCRKLGLGDHLVPTNRGQKNIYVFSGGRLNQIPEGLVLMVPTRLMPFLKSRLISPLGKLRMAMDLFIPSRKDNADESLADFARRRLGQEALSKIVEPLMAGIYVGTAETLSLECTFPKFRDLEREYGSLIRGMMAKRREAARAGKGNTSKDWTLFMSLREGMGELTAMLVSRLGGIQLVTEKGVRIIRSATPGKASYQVELDDGTLLPADAVILTTPAFVSAEILERANPQLSQVLRQIPYVSTATVTLAYPKSGCPHPLDGYGFVVSRPEGRKIMACTWTSTKFPNRAPKEDVLIRCFVGGATQESLVDLDDPTMIQMVCEELKSILGIGATPILAKVYRWKRANPQYTVGHLERLAQIEGQLNRLPGIFLAGSAYNGVGIPDCIHDGTRTADKALAFVQKE